MKSLAEIEEKVESFAKTQPDDSGRTLWDRLVEGSRQTVGAGCDGFLMSQLEEHT